MCSISCFKHKSLKVKETLRPCLLSSLCSWALAAFQSQPGWLRSGHREGEGRAAYAWRRGWRNTAHTNTYMQQTHTSLLDEAVVGSSTRPRLQRDPTEAEQTNRGGPGPREMIEPTDGRGRETSNKPPGWKDKGKRKVRMRGMKGKRRTSRRPHLLFSIWAPSLDIAGQTIDGRKGGRMRLGEELRGKERRGRREGGVKEQRGPLLARSITFWPAWISSSP